MPIVLSYTTNVGPDEYDEVVDRLRYHDELPEGLIMHTAAVTDTGELRVIDIWESREHHDRFLAIRGCPTLLEVAGEQRVAQDAEVLELHSLVRP
ncbi:MAG: hypothetical protein JW895_11200 [Thermoleophilaceae bacterium]|nr:hypothetical protein [Thermoleophilaceae bacterium]